MSGKPLIRTFDAEADGLLDTATKVHCLSVKDYLSGQRWDFRPEEVGEGLKLLNESDIVVGHNIIKYDLPLFELVKGWVPRVGLRVVDTLVLSQLFNPDRGLPPGCPFNHPRKPGEKAKGIGPHSVAAWGYRVGRGKVSYDSWKEFDEGMMKRCSEDVEIQHLILKALEKESGWSILEEHVNEA